MKLYQCTCYLIRGDVAHDITYYIPAANERFARIALDYCFEVQLGIDPNILDIVQIVDFPLAFHPIKLEVC